MRLALFLGFFWQGHCLNSRLWYNGQICILIVGLCAYLCSLLALQAVFKLFESLGELCKHPLIYWLGLL